jgi:hypothetical protein
MCGQIERLTGLRGSINNDIRLRYYGPNAIALGHWLYYAPGLPCLTYKRKVWERFT